jgi:hypothetical protein
MTFRFLSRAVLLLLAAAVPVRAADTKYTIKVVTAEAPKELQDPIRTLLGDRCIQLLDGKGEVLAEVWMRKEVPGKATEAQVKNGLTLREIPESSLFGAVRVSKQLADYKKQKVPAGVYTLRLGYQPENGDHQGTAPYNEFCLACPAADDKSAATMPIKSLYELSAKTTGGHPGVFLLFPGKDATAEPKLVDKGDGQWTIVIKQDVTVGGMKTPIGIGLTLIGTSPSA